MANQTSKPHLGVQAGIMDIPTSLLHISHQAAAIGTSVAAGVNP